MPVENLLYHLIQWQKTDMHLQQNMPYLLKLDLFDHWMLIIIIDFSFLIYTRE